MENNKKYETLMQELSNENDAIRQSVIIGRIIQDTADKTQQAADKAAERSHRIIKWLAWLLALSIAVNIQLKPYQWAVLSIWVLQLDALDA